MQAGERLTATQGFQTGGKVGVARDADSSEALHLHGREATSCGFPSSHALDLAMLAENFGGWIPEFVAAAAKSGKLSESVSTPKVLCEHRSRDAAQPEPVASLTLGLAVPPRERGKKICRKCHPALACPARAVTRHSIHGASLARALPYATRPYGPCLRASSHARDASNAQRR